MLTIDEFQEYVTNHLEEYLPESNPVDSITAQMIRKNNDVKLHAVVVTPKGCHVAPTIYMENFYRHYEEGQTIEDVMQDISYFAVEHFNGEELYPGVANDFMNFDAIKDQLVITLVNGEKNKEYLSEVPHRMKEDLAIVYRVLLDSSNLGMGSIVVRNEHMDRWDVDEDTLFFHAMENSERLMPSRMEDLMDVVSGLLGGDVPEDAIADMMPMLDPKQRMYVITNEHRTNGAGALVYSDALDALATKLGTDLYILPSSIHEVIALSTENSSANVDALSAMVREVNASQVREDEQLSDHVYHYDAASQELKLADTTVEELGLVSSNAEREEALSDTENAARSAARK